MLKADESKDLNQKTWAGWSSLHIITTCCVAVQSTKFIAPDPKPDWFDSLNNALIAAQATATDWVDNLSVNITKTIPTAIVDYSTDYAAFSDAIMAIAQQYPDAKGADDPHVQQVNALINTLITQVESIISKVEKAGTDMTNWGKLMQKSHDDLTTGASSIQSAETDLLADIDKMNSAIKNLNAMIDGENKAIAYAAAAIGIGIFALIAGIALAFVTFGAGVVVAGAGVAAIIGGAVTWGVMQHKINEQFDEIAKDQKELTLDKQQLVALQGLATSTNSVISSISLATQAIADFRTSWGVFQGELQGVVDKLNAGENSLSTLIAGTFTSAAQQEWNLAMQFAQSLIDQNPKSESHETSIGSNAA